MANEQLIGKRFGRLTIKSVYYIPHQHYKGNGSRRYYFAVCQCDCGNEVGRYVHNLKSGRTKSCGCLRKEITAEQGTLNKKHGFATRLSYDKCERKLYRAWQSMKQTGYEVADNWRESFESFSADVPTPVDCSSSSRLVRIDKQQGYIKGNVEWKTKQEK